MGAALVAPRLEKLVATLRGPRGFANTRGIADLPRENKNLSPLQYYPHDTPQRNVAEASAQAYWEVRTVNELKSQEAAKQDTSGSDIIVKPKNIPIYGGSIRTVPKHQSRGPVTMVELVVP